jgi:hypothetical protein
LVDFLCGSHHDRGKIDPFKVQVIEFVREVSGLREWIYEGFSPATKNRVQIPPHREEQWTHAGFNNYQCGRWSVDARCTFGGPSGKDNFLLDLISLDKPRSLMTKEERPSVSNDEIRRLILRYFYDRNRNATSTMGKRGSAVKISTMKAGLKSEHGLTQKDVQSNLTYLLSQGWVEEKSVQKQVLARGGTWIPSVTKFYQITAAGIDKIEGPGEFTVQRFHGIKIEASGQNVITVGDGNQINAQFGELGEALAELRGAFIKSDAPEAQKMNLVSDIDTIQSQIAKPEPNRRIVGIAWEAVKAAAAIGGCAALAQKVAALIGRFTG